jgi:hypothetical protein
MGNSHKNLLVWNQLLNWNQTLIKWLVIATIFLFWQKLGLFFVKYLRFFVVLDKKQFC